MGWTFTHREKGTSNIDWFRREFCPSEPDRLIDMATKNGVAYGAFRVQDDEVMAIVVMTRWVRGDYYNFGYKDIDETMGPGDDDCPKRIFDLLTPLEPSKADPSIDGNWAAQWRERVEKRLDRPKVTKGMSLRWTFEAWSVYGICTYLGGRSRNLFVTQSGRRVRFSGWRNLPYEVVS